MSGATSGWMRPVRCGKKDPCCVWLRRDGVDILFANDQQPPASGQPVLRFPLEAVRQFVDQIRRGTRNFDGPVQIGLQQHEGRLRHVMFDAADETFCLVFTAQEMGAFYASVLLGQYNRLLETLFAFTAEKTSA